LVKVVSVRVFIILIVIDLNCLRLRKSFWMMCSGDSMDRLLSRVYCNEVWYRTAICTSRKGQGILSGLITSPMSSWLKEEGINMDWMIRRMIGTIRKIVVIKG
jgi:hypothetical protein